MALSNTAIKEEIEKGNIYISPYSEDRLQPASYDVSLGENYFVEHELEETAETNVLSDLYFISISSVETKESTFDPWSESCISEFWGSPKKADYDANSEKKYITIPPHKSILTHTEEYIGGKGNIASVMKTRSSLGRCLINVCKCSGWGDPGYINRWTMTISNNSKYPVRLHVGQPIAQIVFIRTEGDPKQYDGNYNTKCQWSPKNMLPKLKIV
jgi:deoxycytidine triphosphate deaminase